MLGTYNPVTNFASDDPIRVGKVVRTHLNESPDHYTQWAQMEKEAEQAPKGKHTITQVEALARAQQVIEQASEPKRKKLVKWPDDKLTR
ncbi:MAG: hypothetical protein NT075_35045 [Chloroflexi bacterium]|nr:hypothetical protein [Chloroflexota bacterium]